MAIIFLCKNVMMFGFSVGDGRNGYKEEAPYDAIHVGAAAPNVPKAVSLSEEV